MTIPRIDPDYRPTTITAAGTTPAVVSTSHLRVTLTPDDLLDEAITLAQHRARTESTTP